MASFEGDNFGNFDPIDFGEPTPETRIRFEYTLDRLKQLAVGKRTIEIEDVIGDADVQFGDVTRDDLCPMTQYSYEQITDPLFGPHEDVYFTFQLMDGDPAKFSNWKNVLGDHSLNWIHYEGTDVEIYYEASFDTETLYVTDAHDNSISIFSDDFGPMMLDRVTRHVQAMQVGAAHPTEGSMRQLIEILEREIAKRIVGD